ncbi:hypothetical protein BCR44DRAFT_38106, partial [Catenaria anguillulae PL171]
APGYQPINVAIIGKGLPLSSAVSPVRQAAAAAMCAVYLRLGPAIVALVPPTGARSPPLRQAVQGVCHFHHHGSALVGAWTPPGRHNAFRREPCAAGRWAGWTCSRSSTTSRSPTRDASVPAWLAHTVQPRRTLPAPLSTTCSWATLGATTRSLSWTLCPRLSSPSAMRVDRPT